MVNWDTVSAIVASWVVSPVLGGTIAALFLFFIKRTITYQSEMTLAARKIVPLLVAAMTWAFATYLAMKGLKHVIKITFANATLIGLAAAILVYFISRPRISRAAMAMPNEKDSVNRLFTVPLIFAAAMLSFSHGANDVANAVGPLAAINDALVSGSIGDKAPIPLWVMMIGALGIAVGLALYGPKLIRTVGSEITDMDQMRAFCIAMAAALTVVTGLSIRSPG